MAKLLWGKVYYQDHFAGLLQEEPGDRTSFVYDETYLNAKQPAIAHTLPLQTSPHISIAGLHPFFDNLVAEGWLENAQTRLLGKRDASRFELLLAFGYDCAGAVSVVDPEPSGLSELLLDSEDNKEMAVLTSRASLSGVQPKLAVVQREGGYFPARINELSTHIAKFPTAAHDDIVTNEYLTTQAFKALLPEDTHVDLSIDEVVGLSEAALIIKRFDRIDGKRIHFEEFNQLLGRKSHHKYDGSYKEMSHFIRNMSGCLHTENYRLYARILGGLLLGNTDMHLKNFAMFHAPTGMSLTPSYDQVAAAIYQYKTIALAIGGASNLPIGTLKAKNMITMADEFALPKEAVNMFVQQLARNKDQAKDAITQASIGSSTLKNQLIKQIESRWNGTFALISQSL
ncbi:MAG: HipA domain-containing protein [Alphaproteobacteria bacterium]